MHVLDVMIAALDSARSGRFVEVGSTVDAVPSLPDGFDPFAPTLGSRRPAPEGALTHHDSGAPTGVRSGPRSGPPRGDGPAGGRGHRTRGSSAGWSAMSVAACVEPPPPRLPGSGRWRRRGCARAGRRTGRRGVGVRWGRIVTAEVR